MTSGHFGQTGIYVIGCVLAVMAALAPVRAQSHEPAGNIILGGTVQGHVRDSNGRPMANATVLLQFATGTESQAAQAQITHTDSEGAYRFAALQAGVYTLRAEMNGYDGAIIEPVSLAQKEAKRVDLTLESTKASTSESEPPPKPATGKPSEQTPEFFDEPQLTVAGVTQATNSGGHGSDTVLRTTEALAKATVSLSKESSVGSNSTTSYVTESSLRDAVTRNPKDPELHHLLADVEEKLGHPLQAVWEYQRAAELDPSEQHLFDSLVRSRLLRSSCAVSRERIRSHSRQSDSVSFSGKNAKCGGHSIGRIGREIKAIRRAATGQCARELLLRRYPFETVDWCGGR